MFWTTIQVSGIFVVGVICTKNAKYQEPVELEIQVLYIFIYIYRSIYIVSYSYISAKYPESCWPRSGNT